MKCPRAIPFLKQGLAIGAKRHEGFADAWNWLIHSFWHMKLGCGLKWKDKWNGYPEINLKIEAGDGINVDYTGGKVVISLGDGVTNDNESDGGGGNDPNYDSDGTGSGGNGGDGTHPDGSHSSGGGAGGGGAGGGGAGGGGAGGGGNGRGSSCNTFSDDAANGDEDPGMENSGDDCAVVNGW